MSDSAKQHWGLNHVAREAGKRMLALGMQGGPLHKKYKTYLE